MWMVSETLIRGACHRRDYEMSSSASRRVEYFM